MPATATWAKSETLDSHGLHWRPDWIGDRQCLYWYLTFDDEQLADALGEQLLAQLHSLEWLDAVPPRWMHLTLCEVGYLDQVDDAAVESMVHKATEVFREHRSLRITLGSARPLWTAVALAAEPQQQLRGLGMKIADLTRQAVAHTFWPHVSLGYVNRHVDQHTVRETLAVLPRTQVDVEVDRLTLARVSRRDRHYQWTVDSEVNLMTDPSAVPSRSGSRAP